MRIRVLGTLELVDPDGSGAPLRSARLRRMLAALLVSAGEVVSVDRLAAAVWGEQLHADPTNAVQILVSRLRRVLGPDPALLTRAPGYLLTAGRADADEFARMAAEARTEGRPQRAVELLDQALRLWRGPAFAE